jgi:hypothetical protein
MANFNLMRCACLREVGREVDQDKVSIKKVVLQVAINLADGEGLRVELVSSQIEYLRPIKTGRV